MLPCSALETAPPVGTRGVGRCVWGRRCPVRSWPGVWSCRRGCSLQERRTLGGGAAAACCGGGFPGRERSFRTEVGWCRLETVPWMAVQGPSPERWFPFLPDVSPGSLALSPPCAELSCCTWPGGLAPCRWQARGQGSPLHAQRGLGPRTLPAPRKRCCPGSLRAGSPHALSLLSAESVDGVRSGAGRPLFLSQPGAPRGEAARAPGREHRSRSSVKARELELERLGADTRARLLWAVVAGGFPEGSLHLHL